VACGAQAGRGCAGQGSLAPLPHLLPPMPHRCHTDVWQRNRSSRQGSTSRATGAIHKTQKTQRVAHPPRERGSYTTTNALHEIFVPSCVAPVARAAEGSDTKGSPSLLKGGACVAGGVARGCREPLELDSPPSNPQECSPRHQREHRVPAPQEWAVLQNLIHQHPDETNEALAQRMNPHWGAPSRRAPSHRSDADGMASCVRGKAA